jgi:DNA-binding SARP family transcriptional activator
MYFRLLGTLRAEGDDGQVDFGGLRQQRLLAMLLLDANRVVSADRLIDALWNDDPPATARRQLHNAVASLRRALGAAKSIVVKDGPGYRIGVAAEDIDARRFTAAVARASVAAAQGRAAAAVQLLEDCLALWEGPALSGLDTPVLTIAAAKLEEKRLCAIEQLFELRLQQGDAAALVAQLGELVSLHPLREETRRLLILAMHGSGRKADALNAYEQGRRLLRAEMGVDPGARLRELYERILRDDLPQPKRKPEPTWGRPVAAPEHRGGAGANRSLLPYDTAHFTGRVEELRLLAAPRSAADTALGIVAIDGMAGVGKTTLAVRLAHQLAHRYPDGHLFIDLHGHTAGQDPLEPDAALERLLLDLGVPAAEMPGDSRQLAARWRAEVAERRILLVLDDVIDAQQVRPLLPGTGKAQVIITSRRRLVGIDGVTFHSLDVFPPQDAAEFFTRVADAGRTTSRHDAVAEIVALCGHLPLAVSIAASRFHNRPVWSLEHLIFRLRDERRRLPELSIGERDVATPFDVSYRRLSAEQRRLFCVVGFATDTGEEFDAGTAAALLDLPVARADRLLEELFDAHLLRQRTAGLYHYHELLQAYARAKAATELNDDDGTPDAFEPGPGYARTRAAM